MEKDLDQTCASEEEVGVGPWPGGPQCWPRDPHFDQQLLAKGDRRNVADHFRYWSLEAIKAHLDITRHDFDVAIENLDHDFNIGSIVRSANAFGARGVHIIGRRRWNRRGAMVTDRYQQVDHFFEVEEFLCAMRAQDRIVIGIDNIDGSVALEGAALPKRCVLVFGSETSGLSESLRAGCQQIHHITQYGSTRSINVGAAAAVAMWAWVIQHANPELSATSAGEGQ